MQDFYTQELPPLPDFLSHNFEMVSCLKHSDEGTVCLLKEKESRRIVLLKQSADPLIQRTYYNEKELLDTIHAEQNSRQESFFPRSILLEKHDQCVYYIRSYIQGHTLEDLCESNRQKPGLPEDQVLDYAIHLAEQLYFLHSMTPPVIHRDIKPQNVIVDDAGHCHFIDMGISRFYDQGQRRDTLIMGTQHIAPPEQFGFRQTDSRSDLYSLGVLIYYCITGEYEITEEGLSKVSPTTGKVIRKATMFDPDQRYENVTLMLEELLRARYPYFSDSANRTDSNSHRRSCRRKTPLAKSAKHTFFRLRFVLFLILGISAALSLGGIFWRTYENGIYSFTEPLIEEAVCQQLKLEPGTVTRRDLKRIEELHIFGQQIYEDDSQVWLHGDDPWFYQTEFQESNLYRQNGAISDLSDIRHMPNLRELCLYNQQISDISTLADRNISYLGLGYNPLTDISPLAENESITALMLPDLALEDYNVLKTLPNLQRVNLGNNPITSLDCLMGCPLTELDLYLVNLDDYSQIRQFSDLKTLKLNWIDHEIMALLEGMPISDLQFYYSSNFSLSDIKGLADLEKLTFFGDQGPLLIDETPIQLPKLQTLTLTFTQLSDFSVFSQLEALTDLNIYGAEILDIEGLDKIPNLQSVDCSNDLIETIKARYPDADFYVE